MIEIKIAVCVILTNAFDERRAYLKRILEKIKAAIQVLEALMEDIVHRHYELMCNIAELYQKIIALTYIADDISEYIIKMTKLIEGGLLKSGENIAVEYLATGFARINSTLPEYPARTKPERKIIKSSPIVLRVPADVCPPLLPPCPDISGGSAPAPAPTTAPDPGTTTTTKKPDCKGCGIFGFGVPGVHGPQIYTQDYIYGTDWLTEGEHRNMVSLIRAMPDILWLTTPVHAHALIVAPCTKMTTSKGTFTGPAVIQSDIISDRSNFNNTGKTLRQLVAANPPTWYGSPMTNKFLSQVDMINISQNVIKVECLANCDPCENNAVV